MANSSPRTHAAPFADDQLAELMASLSALPSMSATGDVAELRRVTAERSAQRPPGPEMPTVDLSLADGRLGARLYRPDEAVDAVVVYLHGGGWTIGGVESHDRACRRLAGRSRVPVLAVDYRLAPEHPAPAAIDDAVSALDWVASAPNELGGRPAITAVAGDSAGGTLAALAAIRTRGTDAAPDLSMLLYANTHLAATGGSMDDNAHGFGLDAADIAWFNAQWMPDRSRWSDPDVSPLMVGDLSGICPTLIVTCELDPLRDQTEAFGRRLVEAGVPVTARRESGMVHNFLLWDLLSPACAAAGDRVADDLATAIAQWVTSGARVR